MLRARLPRGQNYAPAVGWDACEVLAHVGVPIEVTTISTQAGSSQHWSYNFSFMGGLVVLVPGKGGRFIVESVVWQ